MLRRNRLRSTAPRVAVFCALALLAALDPSPARGSDPAATTDEERFVDSLAAERNGPADPVRLAKLFFGLASALDGGRTSARELQSVIPERDPGAATGRTTLVNSYKRYEEGVSRLQAEVSTLIDRPESAVRLYRTLTAGYRACSQWDNYLRLVQSYGVSTAEMMTVLPTIEACRRFRRVAQQPRVEALILDALSHAEPSDEVRALREELRAMEELLEDLRRIDEEGAEPPR